MDVGREMAGGVAGIAWNMASSAASSAVSFVSSFCIRVLLKYLAFIYVFERAVAFAAPRTPHRPPAMLQLALRVPVVAAVVWHAHSMLQSALGTVEYPAAQLWKVDLTLKFGLFVEYGIAIRAGTEPFSVAYTSPELSLLVHEAQRTQTLDRTVSAYWLLALWAQLVGQLNGIFGLNGYRLYTSGAIAVPYLLHSLHLIKEGSSQHPGMLVIAYLRALPLLTVICLSTLCFGVYYLVSLCGGGDNMAVVLSEQSFPRNVSFQTAWFELGEQVITMSPGKSYMAEARPVTMHQPYLNLERPSASRPEGQHELRPMSDIIDGIKALLRLLKRREPLLEETNEPDWVPFSESESESDDSEESTEQSEFDLDPPSPTEKEIVDLHSAHGRLTRAQFAQLQGREYLARKLATQRDYAPQRCVVCLEAAREIVLWPCGCLCLCQECRGALGNQYTERCICCRAAVTGYSRVYMP